MNPAPGIMPWISPGILTQRPHHKLIGILGSHKDIGVIPIQTPFCLDAAKPSILEIHLKVMPFLPINKFVGVDGVLIFEVFKNCLNKGIFFMR